MLKVNKPASGFGRLNAEEKRAAWLEISDALGPVESWDAYGEEWLREREAFYKNGGYTRIPQQDMERLVSLKGKFKGNRIFIIGNGPSLNKTALHKLKNEYTFGVNRINLLYDKIDWKPTFYTIIDRRVVGDTFGEVNSLTGSILFFDEKFRGLLREGGDVYYFNNTLQWTDPREEFFSFDATKGIRSGNTVVGTAIQLAFYMGFDPIYLIGCDLGYKVLDTVSQEGEDKFSMGVKFDLKSTKDDDPNHFDSRYFGKDRLWHAPNVKGMVEYHEHHKRAIEGEGRRIFNATVGGELEVYQRVDFDSLFPDDSYTRNDHAVVDETAVVSELLRGRRGAERVMLDVGACSGSSAMPFLRRQWMTYCFEPDPANLGVILKRLAKFPNAKIDSRAVSDRVTEGVPFFSSKESKGISSLGAFRDSHFQSATVNITTIAEIVKEHSIKSVDFLKIDVEGFDFNVLRGVPWDTIKPDVIECEYEDAKTVPMGHRWQDIADYLRERGYAVYVSEWHPIIRYGVPHDWRRVVPYPGFDVPSDSWGNLLAFREDPGYAAIHAAFEKLTQRREEKASEPPIPQTPVTGVASPVTRFETAPASGSARQSAIRPAPAATVGPEIARPHIEPVAEFHRPFYADFGERLMWRSPRLFRVLQRSRRAAVRFPAWLKAKAPPLFRLGQVVGWLFRAAWRHKISAVVLLAVCAALVAAPFYDARLWAWRHGLWEIAAALLVAAAAGVILRETVRRLAGTNETVVAKAAHSARQASERRSGELEKRLGAFAAEAQRRADASEAESRKGTEILRSEIARLTAELSETAGNAGGRETELRAELRRIAEALNVRDEALRADFQALRQGIDQRLHAEIEEHATGFEAALRGQFDELRKAGETQGKRLAGFETALDKVQSQAVSLDVVSALRAMRPLWLGGSAVDTLKQQPEIEHGHALLMAVLADEAQGKPDWFGGKTLIEIGSTRERDAAQGSTEKLAIFTTMTGMRFVTVDMDSQNTGRAKQILRHLNPAGQAITAKGEDYLALHAGPIDVVYLDAFDFDHGHHSEQRQERYRAVLHTDINDDACWRMHLACAETLAARMPEGGIVALDDTWTDGDGNYLGKGKLAMPFLLDNGFEIIARTRMTVALRRAVKGRAKKAKAAAGGRKKRAV